MKIPSSFLLLCVVMIAAFWLQCDSLNGIQLAGGSGAGNPGGTVSVALTINLDTMVTTATNIAGATGTKIDIAKAPVVVKDMAGLPITITGVVINSSDLRLVLDDLDEPRHVLDSLRERPDYISTDSQSLVINKQFSFNCLQGTPDSSVPPMIMPVAHYTGVMLNFDQYAPSQTDTGWKSKIQITGYFDYKGAPQNFIVQIYRTFSPYYKFAGGIFTLSHSDTTHLELRFNASQWFHRVNFKQAVDQEPFSSNTKNAIIISSYSTVPGIADLEYRIKTDFIMSGKLAVY
jgi:hypothetical protein